MATDDQSQTGQKVNPSNRSSLFESSFEPEPPEPDKGLDKPSNKKHSYSGIKHPRFWIPVLINLLTLGAVIWYACEAHKQSATAIAGVAVARKALTEVQRAFITFPSEATILYFTDPRDKSRVVYWEISFPIENSGTTPTRAMRDHISMHVSKGPIRDDFVLRDQAPGQDIPIVIGPKARIGSPILRVMAQELVAKNPPHIYIYGWAAYRDIFTGTPLRLTKFCYTFQFTGNPVAATTEGLARHGRPCAVGEWRNCVDDECPDYEKFAAAERR